MSDAVYRERAALVAHLTRIYPDSVLVHRADPAEEEWPVLYIDTSEGQLSWHISKADLDLFAHVPWGQAEWDGHTTEEKYERLQKLGMIWHDALN